VQSSQRALWCCDINQELLITGGERHAAFMHISGDLTVTTLASMRLESDSTAVALTRLIDASQCHIGCRNGALLLADARSRNPSLISHTCRSMVQRTLPIGNHCVVGIHAGNEVYIYDARFNKPLRKLSGHVGGIQRPGAFVDANGYLWIAGQDGRLRQWNLWDHSSSDPQRTIVLDGQTDRQWHIAPMITRDNSILALSQDCERASLYIQ
jgi:hypothetical protein